MTCNWFKLLQINMWTLSERRSVEKKTQSYRRWNEMCNNTPRCLNQGRDAITLISFTQISHRRVLSPPSVWSGTALLETPLTLKFASSTFSTASTSVALSLLDVCSQFWYTMSWIWPVIIQTRDGSFWKKLSEGAFEEQVWFTPSFSFRIVQSYHRYNME